MKNDYKIDLLQHSKSWSSRHALAFLKFYHLTRSHALPKYWIPLREERGESPFYFRHNKETILLHTSSLINFNTSTAGRLTSRPASAALCEQRN